MKHARQRNGNRKGGSHDAGRVIPAEGVELRTGTGKLLVRIPRRTFRDPSRAVGRMIQHAGCVIEELAIFGGNADATSSPALPASAPPVQPTPGRRGAPSRKVQR